MQMALAAQGELAGLHLVNKMNKFKYSPSTNYRYPTAFLSSYAESGTLPADVIDISDDISDLYFDSIPPAGKVRIAGQDGLPAWGDIPEPPNDVLLSQELSSLGNAYKKDIADLNTAYLAAIVSDGPSEVTKQQVVRDQITQRKSQYVADIAAAKEKYPI